VWMQRVCLHAVCLAEPDADSEAWDAISAVSVDAGQSENAIVLRATRDIEAGVELLLDYGARSNAELLSTHGFALAHNPADFVPIALAPRDEQAVLKSRLLAAGNLTEPFHLSPRALREDSEIVVALRVIAATPTELQRYADAFRGQPLSTRNERKWRLMLRETVEALLAEAEQETTAEQDRLMLVQARPGAKHLEKSRPYATNSSNGKANSSGSVKHQDKMRAARRSERRQHAAVVCRLGEKNLLREVLDDLNHVLSSQRKQISAGSGPGS